MINCICVNVSETTVREHIREGYDTVEKLQDKLGVALQCCLCLPYIKDMIEDEFEQ